MHVSLSKIQTSISARLQRVALVPVIFRKKILFDELTELDGGLSIRPLSLSNFIITKEIYAELLHLLFTKSVWHLDDLETLSLVLDVIPKKPRQRICSIAFRLEGGRDCIVHDRISTSLPVRQSYQTLRKAAYVLRKDLKLGSLTLYLHVKTFDWLKVRSDSEAPFDYDYSVSQAVQLFNWEGLETRLPFSETEFIGLEKFHLINELKGVLVRKSVQWVPGGEDRYRGRLGDIVIGRKATNLAR